MRTALWEGVKLRGERERGTRLAWHKTDSYTLVCAVLPPTPMFVGAKSQIHEVADSEAHLRRSVVGSLKRFTREGGSRYQPPANFPVAQGGIWRDSAQIPNYCLFVS